MAAQYGPRYHVPHHLVEARPLKFLAELPAMLARDHGLAGVEEAELSYRMTPGGDRLVAWEAFYGRDAAGILRQSILSYNFVVIHQAGLRSHETHYSATLLGDTDLPFDCADYCVRYAWREPASQPGRSRWAEIGRVDLRFDAGDLPIAA